MNDLPTQGVLDLEVKDFGPIVKANIDLRPLMVLIGPSNTGKSYLASLIYALHRYFSSRGWPGRRRYSNKNQMYRGVSAKIWSEKTLNEIKELGLEIHADEGKSFGEEGIVLPDSVTDIIRSLYGEQSEYLGYEIDRCFGIEKTGALIRKEVRGSACISFRREYGKESAVIDSRLMIGAQKSDFKTIIPENAQLRIGGVQDVHGDRHLLSFLLEMLLPANMEGGRKKISILSLLDGLAEYIRPQIVGPLGLPAFYLPSDRTGIMHAHSVVVRALIGSAAMTGLRPAARTPTLSGIMADFLEQLITLNRTPLGRLQYTHGARIEKAILGGSVSISNSEAIDYPHFTYKPEGWKDSLPLMNVSSMVSELAPVVLYLRHLVKRGNVLIIEEPESHLHPAMQVEFTRQIAMLVKSGIRVIITTHSEWVLEELANIVRRSNLPTSVQNATTKTKIALRSNQVGAWLFKRNKRPKGSVVEEIILDDETGLYPTGFDDVSAELYNESVNIFSQTQQSNDT